MATVDNMIPDPKPLRPCQRMWNAPTARPSMRQMGKTHRSARITRIVSNTGRNQVASHNSQVLDMANRNSHSDMAIMKM